MEEAQMEENEEVKNPEAVLAELRRAQEDLKALRADLKSVTTERDSLREKINSQGDDPFRSKAIAAEAKLALQAQGIKDVDRLMPYVGTEGLDFDEKGGITGLNERLEVLKKDLPEIFDPKRRAGGKADIFANDAAEQRKDPFKDAVHHALNP